jgi:pimeloyl-ACP methyl ester carboxylesterase
MTTSKTSHFLPTDLLGLSRLAVGATAGATDLVESLHGTIVRAPGPLSFFSPHRPGSITNLVYRGIRGVTRLTGGSLEVVLRGIVPLLGEKASSPQRENLLAILNGVLGDELEATKNPLAIPMSFRLAGRPLRLEKASLGAAFPEAGGRILVLAHGLCRNDLQWKHPDGGDGGGEEGGSGEPGEGPIAELARELGYTVVMLHYNSGRHISSNGRVLSGRLEALVNAWPVPPTELAIVAHSMGGLVTRSACESADAGSGLAWRRLLRRIVFLGTPHHGAPLERGGNLFETVLGFSSFTEPFTRLAQIRSAGITDLRYGILHEETWLGFDRFERGRDPRRPTPLPAGVDCFAVAGTTGKRAGDLQDRLLGDGLVKVGSALGRHEDVRLCLDFPPGRQLIAAETRHLQLVHDPAICAKLRDWL